MWDEVLCTDEKIANCCDPTNNNPTDEMIEACFENNCNWILNARGTPFCLGTDFDSCLGSCIVSTPEITTTESMFHKY